MKIVFSFRWCGWKQRSLKKYEEVWEGVKKKLKQLMMAKKIKYGKDF